MSSLLFKFGLISDVQWADIPDGASFHGQPRYYRDALISARRAVAAFQSANVSLAVHLGDIVDYHNSLSNSSEAALQAAVDIFDALDCPVLHAIGNHCLYNAPRPVLNKLLSIDDHKQSSSLSGQHSYFSFHHNHHVIIMLDGYDISFLGWPPTHPLHQQAVDILNTKNPNTEKNSNAGLEGLDKRFVKFGGGVSATQLAWVRKELTFCKTTNKKAFICCHLCLHPRTCPPTCLLWNYDEVLEEFKEVVIATFTGHAHKDGYYYDVHTGIHHRVCHGVLETVPGEDCYGIVEVFEDKVEIKGQGTFSSATWLIGATTGEEVHRVL